MDKVELLLLRTTSGKVKTLVKFGDIKCPKKDFSDYGDDVAMDEMERYGVAIRFAKELREKEWVLTDKDILAEKEILIYGEVEKVIETLQVLQVGVDVGKNVFFLASQGKKKLRAMSMVIEGSEHPKENDARHPGHWAVFSNIPK